MNSYELYQIQSMNLTNNFDVIRVENTLINSIQEGLESLVTFNMGDKSYITGFDSTNKIAVTYESLNKESGKYFKQVGTSKLSFGTTIVDTFYMGGKPMLLAYDPTDEHANLIQISNDFQLTSAYQVKIGKGLSTVKTFSYRFGQYFIGYDIETGSVAKYQISIPPNQAVYAEKTWSATWAKGWTRFSFFQLGGENFFIKTNIKYNKVNIDHFMDDANESSHPVLNMDAPDQMIGVHLVSAFTDEIGIPYFATYRSDGKMTFNGIHGNCLGWDILANKTSVNNASNLFPFMIGNENYVLVYNNQLTTTVNKETNKAKSYA